MSNSNCVKTQISSLNCVSFNNVKINYVLAIYKSCLTFESKHLKKCFLSNKGACKYYVSKEVGGWGKQMLMFADKGGWVGVAKC